MSSEQHKIGEAERESRAVAEASRQQEWTEPSFLRELFLGRFRLDLIHPFPTGGQERPEFVEWYGALSRFLLEEVDSAEIDRTGEYPARVVERLKQLGAFGMKIPKEYGGLGFSQVEYDKVMHLIGTCDGNLGALLSAHQSIGVPQPLKMFGTDAQKKEWLPRCAKGAISGFALTEPSVGSDPASLATTYELTPDGQSYVINGEKLWCTNGTIAELLVVMARHPTTKKISAFVVEMSAEGVEVTHRCRFMGLTALANAVIRFTNVRVPKDNLIGGEGKGLKIALTTLNTGRLALPAASTGTAKVSLETARKWAKERVQWGRPIGKHEAIAHLLADMAATTFAMDSVSQVASQLADRGGYDIRLEAAAAKEWNTTRCWYILDDTMQIRGGRGYEKETSLAARGERPIGVERMFRDFRIDRIFEGSSEVMHLFIAREAVDPHLQVAGSLIDPKASFFSKIAALPKMVAFYARWYPARWIGWGAWPRYGEWGRLARHVRFLDRTTRKLGRQIFHGMLVHQAKLQTKQAFLFRIVDIALELFAMAVTVSRAKLLLDKSDPHAKEAQDAADMFCRSSERKVRKLFHDLWANDDSQKYRFAQAVLDGQYAWFESSGSLGIDRFTAQENKPASEPVREGARVAAEGAAAR